MAQNTNHNNTRNRIIDELGRMFSDGYRLLSEDGVRYQLDPEMVADRVESGTMDIDDAHYFGPWWVAMEPLPLIRPAGRSAVVDPDFEVW